MSGKRWTSEELELVDRLYPNASWGALLAALPRRTHAAIQVRGNLRGIKRLDYIRASEQERWFWTHQEDAILRCGWTSGLPVPAIMALLPNRRKDAIHQRRMHLKLPSRQKCWTPEEREALRRLYPLASWDEIFAALPGRSYPAIIMRAILLRLTRLAWDSGRGGTKKAWSAEEDRILKRAWLNGLPVQDICTLLPGRSYTSIAGHRKSLDLPSRMRCWTAEELETLDCMYPCSSWKALLAALPGRTQNAVKTRAITRNITKLVWEGNNGTNRRAGYKDRYTREEEAA